MADNTAIEWADATWNPITGCRKISPGCTHCYAARLAATRLKHHPSRKGLASLDKHGNARWSGEFRFNGKWVEQPLRWKRPRRIFVCAHSDLFGATKTMQKWVFDIMEECRRHQFLILTKRPERMRRFLWERWGWSEPAPENIWLGVSVESQEYANRILELAWTPAHIRWVSLEPLLGPVDLRHIPTFRDNGVRAGMFFGEAGNFDALAGKWTSQERLDPESVRVAKMISKLRDSGLEAPIAEERSYSEYRALLNWVVVGGESGPRARSFLPHWVRNIRDQCTPTKTPFFFKQWGGRTSKENGRELDGRTWEELPWSG